MANKKINQLVLKTTIQSTDLFPLGDATTGQLYKKTIAELQAAIGGAVISVNGLVGTVVLDTDDIQELASPTNKYFTDARARAAISLTVTGSSGASTYSSSTGVLNVPTYTLAGLGGITASFLSGTSGISYNSSTGVISYTGTVYTDSSIRALVSATGNISYNSSTGVFSTSLTQYTDALARAALSGTAPITYNSTTGAIGITQATTSTDGYLSSTDWNTFNGKQGTITLTTTGTSGAATFSGGTLNIPQYQGVLTNPVTGTGTTNYIPKWTSSSALGNSSIQDVSATYVSIIKNAAAITDPILYVSPSTTSSASILNLDNSGAGSFYVGRQNSAGNSALITGLGASAGVLGHTGTQSLHLVTNAASRITITGTGNVGIGGTPNDKLQVGVDENAYLSIGNGGSTDVKSGLRFRVGGGGTIYSAMESAASSSGNGYLTFSTIGSSTLTERMRITSAGTVQVKGVGAGSDSLVVYYGGSAQASFQFAQGGSDGYFKGYNSAGSGGFQLHTQGFSYINNSSNFAIGTTSDNGERLYVSGSIRATGSITANSDARLKKNIERIENALEKVGQISGYTYNTIYDEDRHAGVIAQEIDKVLPEIVNKGNDGLMGVEYGNISALLIEAIKEQKVLIESLQAKVEALSK